MRGIVPAPVCCRRECPNASKPLRRIADYRRTARRLRDDDQPLANQPPAYPAALLPLALPPRVVTARLVVDADGRVTDAAPVDLDATDQSGAMFASVRDAVLRWRFFPLVKIVAGAGKTTLRTHDVETTYDGKAISLPFSEVYQFTFTQSAGVGRVGVGGR